MLILKIDFFAAFLLNLSIKFLKIRQIILQTQLSKLLILDKQIEQNDVRMFWADIWGNFRFKFYQIMKKVESLVQNPISTHYFAVYPLYLDLPKEHPAHFILYFQKSLQIIAKHTPYPSGLSRSFDPPERVQHFRVASDKNLEYQWSLYKYGTSSDEEFIQTQKISLKTHWSTYQGSKECIIEQEADFRNVKFKLKYMIVIGRSNQDLLEKVQNYLKAKNTPPSEIKVGNFIEEEKSGERHAEKNPEIERVDQVKEVVNYQIPPLSPQKQENEAPLSQPVASNRILIEQAPQNQEQQADPAPIQEEKQLLQTQEQDLKLTHSQLQIGEEIQNQVNQYEEKVNLSVKPEEPTLEQESLKPNEYDSAEPKEMTIIQSQMLNSKQEVMVPLYKTPKFIVFAVILLLFSGLAVNSLNGTKEQSKKERQRIKKGKEVKLKQKIGKERRKDIDNLL